MKIIAQLMLPTIGGWRKKVFPLVCLKHPETELFLPFYLTEKHQICILYQKAFVKNCVKELCKKSTENKPQGILHTSSLLL